MIKIIRKKTARAMRNRARYLVSVTVSMALLLAVSLSLTSCAENGQATATTVPTNATETALTGSLTTAPPGDVTTSTTAPSTAELSATEKIYRTMLDNYYRQFPAQQPGSAASDTEQSALVDRMVELFEQRASTKDLFTLYSEGITKLSPEQADRFTLAAMSGMRRNSFEDYTAIENLASKPGFLDRFFKEAERFDYDYAKLNQDTANIEDQEIRSLVETAKAQGYYVASAEGMLFYLVDFTEFARFRAYNSQPLAKLIETLAIDSLDHMASDGAFIIDGQTLAARTYNIEKMLTGYQGTQLEKYLAIRFKDHMTLLFFGVDNTPTFDYETREIKLESLALFTEVMTLEGTHMARMVSDYTTLIEANHGRLDEETQNMAYDILKALDDQYGLTDDVLEEYSQWMSGQALPA